MWNDGLDTGVSLNIASAFNTGKCMRYCINICMLGILDDKVDIG